MKLKLPSYATTTSPSIASSSSASFDASNSTGGCSKSSANTAGCLAAILRRILCSQSLPTHPSDHFTDTEVGSFVCQKNRELESKDNTEDRVMPSIVARLMGLEAIPNATPSSITRSRSMNSLDFKASGDQMQGDKHRRVKSSTLSIGEMPTFFEIESEEFFVLSFGNVSEDKEKRSRRRKFEMGYGELKQRRREKCKKKNKGDQQLSKKVSEVLNEKKLCRTVSNKPEKSCMGLEIKEFSTPVDNNEASHGAKLRKKKKKVRSVELESSSEDSSPVSVLDFDQFIMSENLVESNSRRKLSPEPDQNYDCQSRRNDNNLMILNARKTKKSEGKCVGSRKRYCHINSHSHNYLDICDQICKITEAEVAESNWLYRRDILRHEDFEDICADLELQILDQSLDQLVHQLIGLAM